MHSIIMAPSLLSADFSCLRDEIKDVEQAGVQWLHLDVMDGLFVPNITFGAPVIKKLRPVSNLFFDCHLMIAEPTRYIDDFVKAGADLITVHEEAVRNVSAALEQIRATGVQVGISLNPETPLEAVAPYLNMVDLVLLMSVHPGFGGQSFIDITYKIKSLREMLRSVGASAKIQVDGGITVETAPKVVAAGANVLVAGSAIFGQSDRKNAVEALYRSFE